MKSWVRPVAVGGISLILGLVAQSRMDAREEALMAKIGPISRVATVSRTVSAGVSLDERNVRFVEVPRRWLPPGAIESPDALVGKVAALRLDAGALLVPGAFGGGSVASERPLGPNERIATVEAIAPIGALHPGVRVDVLSLRAGAKPRFLCRNIEVLSAKESTEGATDGPGRKIQADLRATVAQALAIASAASSGEEIRMLPLGPGRDPS